MKRVSRQRQKRQSPSPYSPIRPGNANRRIFPRPPAQAGRRFWARFRMCSSKAKPQRFRSFSEEGSAAILRDAVVFFVLGLLLTSCARKPDPNTLVMIIESSPVNLDPRVGIDAQSERIDSLIFDALVHRDETFSFTPSLAERWQISDPLTYVFHLRHDAQFHDGRQLTSRDVKWTFDSV